MWPSCFVDHISLENIRDRKRAQDDKAEHHEETIFVGLERSLLLVLGSKQTYA